MGLELYFSTQIAQFSAHSIDDIGAVNYGDMMQKATTRKLWGCLID